MKELRCLTCGGPLELSEDGLHAKCTVCGNFYEYKNPKLDYWVEQMNEANALRLDKDFDSAIKKYKLIAKSVDSDAEVEWGLMLSKYGIVYEQDPLTEERIPTFHRNNRTNIMDDENAKRAVELASSQQKIKYERDLKTLRHIQAGIEEIAKKSEPYDVFISFKATEIGDTNGEIKTIDRDIAYNIYDELNSKGVKTFFSEATLATKASEDYEAVIFNALNTCKVFILVGTSKENINATWVKNEWTRYRERLIEDQKNGTLSSSHFAVLGADFDVADLPPLFARTQNVMLKNYAGDGYKRDVAKSVYNILGIDTDKPKQTESISQENVKSMVDKLIKERTAQSNVGGGVKSTVEALIKRAKIFLENNDFENCIAKADAALDIDPECVFAYLYKILASNKCKDYMSLSNNATYQLDDDINYKMIMKYGDANTKATMSNINRIISERVRMRKIDSIYQKAIKNENSAVDDKGKYIRYKLETAISQFEKIVDYKDSAAHIKICMGKIKEIDEYPLHEKYMKALGLLGDVKNKHEFPDKQKDLCNQARVIFQELGDYKDSKEYVQMCIETYRKICNAVLQEKRERIRGKVGCSLICLIVIAAIVLAIVFIPAYNDINQFGCHYVRSYSGYTLTDVDYEKESVTIPQKVRGKFVTGIDHMVTRTGRLKTIKVSGGTGYLDVVDNMVINTSDNEVIAMTQRKVIIIPDGVKKLDLALFDVWDFIIKEIVIPASLTNLYDSSNSHETYPGITIKFEATEEQVKLEKTAKQSLRNCKKIYNYKNTNAETNEEVA